MDRQFHDYLVRLSKVARDDPVVRSALTMYETGGFSFNEALVVMVEVMHARHTELFAKFMELNSQTPHTLIIPWR